MEQESRFVVVEVKFIGDTVEVLFENLDGNNPEDVRRASYDINYYVTKCMETGDGAVPIEGLMIFLRSLGHTIQYKINGELQKGDNNESTVH